jgi:hypothetical protein
MALDASTMSAADEISGAVDRLTAAVLTLAMETAMARAQYEPGEVPEPVQTRVMNAYKATYQHLVSPVRS